MTLIAVQFTGTEQATEKTSGGERFWTCFNLATHEGRLVRDGPVLYALLIFSSGRRDGKKIFLPVIDFKESFIDNFISFLACLRILETINIQFLSPFSRRKIILMDLF